MFIRLLRKNDPELVKNNELAREIIILTFLEKKCGFGKKLPILDLLIKLILIINLITQEVHHGHRVFMQGMQGTSYSQ